MFYKNFLLIIAVVTMVATPSFAQETAVINSNSDAAAQSAQVTQLKNLIQAISANVGKITTCNNKYMFHQPTSPEADADGCVGTQTVSLNSTCTEEGAIAKSVTGEVMVCKDGIWQEFGGSGAFKVTSLNGASASCGSTYTYSGSGTPVSLTTSIRTYGGGNRESSVSARWLKDGTVVQNWIKISGTNLWNGNDGGSGMHDMEMATIPFLNESNAIQFSGVYSCTLYHVSLTESE